MNDQSPLDVMALEPVDQNRDRNGAIALIGVILLYGQLFGYGVWVATGVIEEKSSRVVEILLSAIRPRQLMAGKIVGIGLLGLAQLTLIATYAIALGTATGAIDIPGMPCTRRCSTSAGSSSGSPSTRRCSRWPDRSSRGWRSCRTR